MAPKLDMGGHVHKRARTRIYIYIYTYICLHVNTDACFNFSCHGSHSRTPKQLPWEFELVLNFGEMVLMAKIFKKTLRVEV